MSETTPPAAASGCFDQVFAFLMVHEGGFVDDPHDSGGATKYGISRASYPDLDIANLSMEQAKAIYRRDYYDKLRCGEMPGPIALLVFDAAVNAGPARSAKWLQQAVGATPDGVVGPKTLDALRRVCDAKGGAIVCRDLLVSRLFFHLSLSSWSRFGLGWARRLLLLPMQAMTLPLGVHPDV